jgi:hypothetical protein
MLIFIPSSVETSVKSGNAWQTGNRWQSRQDLRRASDSKTKSGEHSVTMNGVEQGPSNSESVQKSG